jgi:hypothetical protein
MDDVEYVGRVSTQRMTSIEQDNKAAHAQYLNDKNENLKRHILKSKPETAELIRERLPEEG